MVSDLPSWMPDLRVKISMFAFARYLDGDSLAAERAYDACGSTTGVIVSSLYRRHMLVRGFSLDTISSVGDACYHNLVEGGLETERTWRSTNADEPYPTGGTVLKAFNHTLLADIARPDAYSEDLQRGACADWTLIDKEDSCLTPEEQRQRKWLMTDIKRATFGRRLIKTSTGLIGLGPAVAEVGDLVCVLFGGHVLYVLRETKEPQIYEFVGESYVHGMMDGAALECQNPRREFLIA